MTKQSTELAIVEQLNINGMDKPAAQKLLDAYGVPFTEAGKLIEQGRAITVTSEDDTENMALARKTRLELRTQRIAIARASADQKTAEYVDVACATMATSFADSTEINLVVYR